MYASRNWRRRWRRCNASRGARLNTGDLGLNLAYADCKHDREKREQRHIHRYLTTRTIALLRHGRLPKTLCAEPTVTPIKPETVHHKIADYVSYHVYGGLRGAGWLIASRDRATSKPSPAGIKGPQSRRRPMQCRCCREAGRFRPPCPANRLRATSLARGRRRCPTAANPRAPRRAVRRTDR